MRKIIKRVLSIVALAAIVGFAIYYFSPSDYYEYEAGSRKDCLQGEGFDEEFGVCYFDFACETEDECAEVNTRYDEVLEQIEKDYSDSEVSYESGHGQKGGHSDDFQDQEVEVFAILDGVPQLDDIVDFDRKEIYLWNQIVALIPQEYRNKIISFETYSRKWSSTMAYVEPIDDTLEVWKMRYNIGSRHALSSDMLPTLVHEFAHILTLDNLQVDPSITEEECIDKGSLHLMEGCALEGSYVQGFSEKFWDESGESMSQDNDEDYEDVGRENFVSDYAQTNLGEDIAESFAFFILRGDKNSSEFYEKEGSEKVAFFYDYPELVAMRDHMRKYMATIKTHNK